MASRLMLCTSGRVRADVAALAPVLDALLAEAVRLLGPSPAEAQVLLARAGEQARAPVAALRRVIDELRAGDVPPPSAADLLELAAGLRALGVAVAVRADEPALPAVALRTAERAVELFHEAFGGPPSRAVLVADAGDLRVELVARRLAAPAGAAGWPALDERVRLLGGEIVFLRDRLLLELPARGAQRPSEAGAASAERTRLARELHDAVGQSLLVVSLQAAAAERLAPADPAAAALATGVALQAVANTRHELDRLDRALPLAGPAC